MAANEQFLCTDLWSSEINGADDGLISIEIGPDPVSGVFFGFHTLPTLEVRTINGQCTHPVSNAGAHVFEFYETALSGERYHYRGVIVPDPSAAHRHRIPHGKRKRVALNLKEKRRDLFDDDEWVGTHVT